MQIFETHRNFPCWNEAQRDEGGGRIRLGDYKGGDAVVLRPIRFSVCWSLDFN
jgi:hypothetical protein